MKLPFKKSTFTGLEKPKEKIEQLADSLQNLDEEKINGKVLKVTGVAVVIGLGLMLAGRLDMFGTDLLIQTHSKKYTDVTPALQTTKGETWADFRKKIAADGRKNKMFPATMAYLRANCNLSHNPDRTFKFRKTYALMKNMEHLRNTADMQILANCRLLSDETEKFSKFTPFVKDGDRKPATFNRLDELFSQMQAARYQMQSILEARKINKSIYGDFYDEKTGLYRTIDKDEVSAKMEREEIERWNSIIHEQESIDFAIEEITGKRYDELQALIQSQQKENPEP